MTNWKTIIELFTWDGDLDSDFVSFVFSTCLFDIAGYSTRSLTYFFFDVKSSDSIG